MKTLILTLILSASNLFGLDGAAIRKIAAEPHSRDNLFKELELYPEAREYKITTQNGTAANALEAGPEVIAKEKTVRGQYIVSEARFAGVENPMIMVVTFDKESATFKKWVLLPNGVVGGSTGIGDLKTRTIAWVSNKTDGEPPMTALSLEVHSDDGSSWTETTLQDGKVVAFSEGVAVKTK